jgi:hypothetical protein
MFIHSNSKHKIISLYLKMKFTQHSILILLIFFSTMLNAQKTAEQIVQANLDAYNNLDIEQFMSYISDDIEVYEFDNKKLSIKGAEACRKIYAELFEQSPKLNSTILKRIVFDNKVIDHEYIIGRRGSDTAIELVLIYEVKDEKIFKISVMRKPI